MIVEIEQDGAATRSVASPIRFDSELVYQASLRFRLWAYGFAGAILLIMLFAAPASFNSLASWAIWFCVVGSGIWFARSARVAFIFGVDGLVFRGMLRTRRLAYMDIAGCAVRRDSYRGRYGTVSVLRVTFESRDPLAEPLQMSVQDGCPLDAAIVERLRSLPQLSSRQLKALELLSAQRP